GGARRGDRRIKIRRRARRERPKHELTVDRRAGLERAGTIAPLTVDEVRVVPAEPRLGPGDGRLEPGVELLVVGAQGRVGDLDPGRGVGRHGKTLMAGGCRGDCGQSSAATTSASVAAMPSGAPGRR